MASKCPQTFSILPWHSSGGIAGQVNWNQIFLWKSYSIRICDIGAVKEMQVPPRGLLKNTDDVKRATIDPICETFTFWQNSRLFSHKTILVSLRYNQFGGELEHVDLDDFFPTMGW